MCYTCTHCNQCGLYSSRTELRCGDCGEPLPIGVSSCQKCGSKKVFAVQLPNAPDVSHKSVIAPSIVR